jgi:type III restriction enzyme
MPYARRRAHPDLNRAYANVTSSEFARAAGALKDKLVKLGFSAEELEETIETEQPELDAALFGPRTRPQPRQAIAVGSGLSEAVLASVRQAAPEVAKVTLNEAGGAIVELTGVPSVAQVKAIAAALPSQARKSFEEAATAFVERNADHASPAQQGARFVMPALMARIQGELELVDPETYTDFADFDLDKLSAQLDAGEFDVRATADVFEIDVNGERLTYSAVARERQGVLDGVEIDGLSHEQIVSWLARSLKDPQFGHGDLVTWVSRTVSHLSGPRGLTLTALNRCMFPLLRALERKLSDFKRSTIEGVYQASLFGPGAKPSVSLDAGFEFRHGMFEGVRLYQGSYSFRRHFLGSTRVADFDGAPEGEEFRCAQALDSLTAVRHWVRNVARHSDAFRLPLGKGWFYPDFVAELTDGRVAAIEYKGEAYATNDDSRDKRAVGQLWQDVSNKKVVFVFVERLLDGLDARGQLERAFQSR